MNSAPQRLQLRSEVGLVGGVSLIAGVMIGSGIFMSPQTMMRNVMSAGASLLIWGCSGVLCMLASLSYAEMGTVIRESGGDYIYILRTSGSLMAFTYAFIYVVIDRPCSMAIQALIVSQNAVSLFYQGCPPPALVIKAVAAVVLLLVSTINCMHVRFSIAISIWLLAIKFLALAVIATGGLIVLCQGDAVGLKNSFEGTNFSIYAIGMAFYQCLWSYGGWNNLNRVTEETKRPENDEPLETPTTMPGYKTKPKKGKNPGSPIRVSIPELYEASPPEGELEEEESPPTLAQLEGDPVCALQLASARKVEEGDPELAELFRQGAVRIWRERHSPPSRVLSPMEGSPSVICVADSTPEAEFGERDSEEEQDEEEEAYPPSLCNASTVYYEEGEEDDDEDYPPSERSAHPADYGEEEEGFATVKEITEWAQEYFQKVLSANTIHRAIRHCQLKLYSAQTFALGQG
ncbi:b(0,+)-type amino acid transporter 1-like [Brachyhypopomus gauderio]|uniref:b(0,+)-type amino acid transporter 1-like n=1 Tax=Brachyhypopomus gauderio TaxID=698409 RepID=UPI004041D02B